MNPSSIKSTKTNPKRVLPEHQFPKWVAKQIGSGFKRMVRLARPPQYELLARFSYDLGTCVRSSVDIVRGLELCLKALRRTRLGACWSGAVELVRSGSSLAQALRGGEDLLPPFFLPVINAGEQTGRLAEALGFLQRHCKLLAGPASALRKLWVYPIAILSMGSIVKVILTMYLASFAAATRIGIQETLSWLQLGLIVVVMMTTPVRVFMDQVRLSIPWIGELEREIVLHRFFRVLALLYSVGGQRVEAMIRTAVETVTNHAAKSELLKAAESIEQGHTLTDAFGHLTILTPDEKGTIEAGDLSGTLEQAFDRISDQTGASMLCKLEWIQPMLMRILAYVVMFSIVGTLLSLIREATL
ncbi:type II secretion system F family protein [Novipirellula artificiosorum]|nr:type II secretion system F family protein [Novipirellula artificiosorum]